MNGMENVDKYFHLQIYRNNLINKKNLDGITEIRVKVFFCPAYVELLNIPSQFSKWKI